tara:strand:+ start:76 stop:450 length:375 start_codon:yes stop_codon:yes gene_type:complete
MNIDFYWDVQHTWVAEKMEDSNDPPIVKKNVVKEVQWHYVAHYTSSLYDVTRFFDQKLHLDTSDFSNFIELEDLNTDKIASWVSGSIGEQRLEELTTELTKQIKEIVEPDIVYKKIPGGNLKHN